ncbi:putative lipoprotein YbaY [Pseudomonas sp. F-14 TE3482]
MGRNHRKNPLNCRWRSSTSSANDRVKGQVPLPFHLSYDPAQVKPGHRYSVSARIEVNGELMFITTEHHAVQLDGSDPQPLKIRVDAAR